MPQEVYPNPPIALTACEVRVPPSGLPISDGEIADIRDRLADVFPVVRSKARQQVTVEVNPSGAEPTVSNDRVLQLTNREQSVVAQIAPESIVLKTADYRGWAKFRPLLSQVLQATSAAAAPGGYHRVGLRYIDEIRLPAGGGQVADWEGYLNDALLAPVSLGQADDDLSPKGWQTVTQFAAGEQHTVVVRYGPNDGYAVNPDQPPHRPNRAPPGPFFLFDIDSYWETDKTIPAFEPDEVTALCDRLHRPVRALFDAAVTDRLRDEVLRKEPA